MKDDSRVLFQSGAASPAELLARVRRRLEAESTGAFYVPSDPEFDLSTGEGLLEGWYHAESHGGATVRWVARRFAFEAEVRDATHVLLDAAIFPESGIAGLRLRTRANDVLGSAVRLSPGWNFRLLPIPAGVSGRVHFFVDTGGSWSPASDPRELSILVRRLALVRFVELPRVGGAPAATPAAPAGPPASLGLRIVRRLRRLILGWDLSQNLLAVEEAQQRLRSVEERLAETERQFNSLAAIVEDRLSQLARVDAETATDSTEREDELQDELARKFLQFFRS